MQSNIKLGYSLRSLHNTSRSGRRQSVVMAEVHNKTVMLLLSFAHVGPGYPIIFLVLCAGAAASCILSRSRQSGALALFSSYSN